MRGKDSKHCHLDEHFIKVATRAVGPNRKHASPAFMLSEYLEILKEIKTELLFPPTSSPWVQNPKVCAHGKECPGDSHKAQRVIHIANPKYHNITPQNPLKVIIYPC